MPIRIERRRRHRFFSSCVHVCVRAAAVRLNWSVGLLGSFSSVLSPMDVEEGEIIAPPCGAADAALGRGQIVAPHGAVKLEQQREHSMTEAQHSSTSAILLASSTPLS